MITLGEVKEQIEANPQHWRIYLMDFVDDFRYYRQETAIAQPFALTNPQMDALLASTVEYLCAELNIRPPLWLPRSARIARALVCLQGWKTLKRLLWLKPQFGFGFVKFLFWKIF